MPRRCSTQPDNFDALHGLGKLSCASLPVSLDAALALIQRALTIDPGAPTGFSESRPLFSTICAGSMTR